MGFAEIVKAKRQDLDDNGFPIAKQEPDLAVRKYYVDFSKVQTIRDVIDVLKAVNPIISEDDCKQANIVRLVKRIEE